MTRTRLFLFLLLGAGQLQGEMISENIRLMDMGVTQPVRMQGYDVEQDFYFPLPVRKPDASGVTVHLEFQGSLRLGATSTLEVLANGLSVGERRLGTDPMVSWDLPLARATSSFQDSNYLKLTLRAHFRSEQVPDRCGAISGGELWMDVFPTTYLQVKFNDQDPDWLSVSRLPLTLRSHPVLVGDAAWTHFQRDLAMKLVSWVAWLRPYEGAGLSELGQQRAFLLRNVDVMILSTGEKSDEAGIRVETVGGQRRIIFSGASEGACAKLWGQLKHLGETPVPGTSWRIESGSSGKKPETLTRISPELLDPGFCRKRSGVGNMAASFGFDRALFHRGDFSLKVRMKIHHQTIVRLGSAAVFLHVNGQLAYTGDMAVGTPETSLDVTIPPEMLDEENLITLNVHYFPTEEECRNPLFHFEWQVDRDAQLQVRKMALAGEGTDDLLNAARRYFGRARYAVLLPGKGDGREWEVLLKGVTWLQKVNRRALMEPVLQEKVDWPRDLPCLAVGFGNAEIPGVDSGSLLPVHPGSGSLEIRRWGGELLHRVDPGASVGIWQLGYRGFGGIWTEQPVILLDGWGPRGMEVLLKTSSQMADQIWMNHGGVVLGDGVSPLYSFVSRDVLVLADQKRQGADRWDWDFWKWWIIVPLWGMMTGLIIWILRHAYRRVGESK